MPHSGKKATGDNSRELVAGQRVFDRYYLKRTLGEGGMGVVWLAHDRVLEQPVALKFLSPHLFRDHHEVERLKHETRRNLKLSHPNIVRIHDFEQDAEHAAIAMEYVDGWSLWTMRVDKANGVFEVDEIAPWIRQLCEALDYAHHQAHIVHRDLKPANLLLNSRGQVKVTDFGLSRDLRRTAKPDSSHPKIVGTDTYMSPQQWTGEPPAVADDIYSLGVTIYELLTGKPPFYEGDIFQQVYEMVPPGMTERLFAFGMEAISIPLNWEETVAACLEKNAARRPASAREVATRLGILEA
jgi:serine/threonine protein kinase